MHDDRLQASPCKTPQISNNHIVHLAQRLRVSRRSARPKYTNKRHWKTFVPSRGNLVLTRRRRQRQDSKSALHHSGSIQRITAITTQPACRGCLVAYFNYQHHQDTLLEDGSVATRANNGRRYGGTGREHAWGLRHGCNLQLVAWLNERKTNATPHCCTTSLADTVHKQ